MFPIASNSDDEKLYSDSVFSTYLYTGNGSTQTITNGIDLAGKGGLVWTKGRSSITHPKLIDTVRGNTSFLQTTNTNGGGTYSGYITSFNSNGFSVGGGTETNLLNESLVSWTFRKAAKFFDIVTYTGSGVAKNITHNLGITPGMIIIKKTNSADAWVVYHRSTTATNVMFLNQSTAATAGSGYFNNTEPTSSVFTVGSGTSEVNALNDSYVAYLFAHDTSSTGIIQCGSTDGSKVTLGWEPQWILHKSSNFSSSWNIIDTTRGMPWGSRAQMLNPNATSAEALSSDTVNLQPYSPKLYADGFELGTLVGDHIYMAIRRPNKPPTSGTQVFSPQTYTDSNIVFTPGFPPDLNWHLHVRGIGGGTSWGSRLTGDTAYLNSSSPNAEGSYQSWKYGLKSGTFQQTISTGTGDGIGWFFKRAPGFFDVVCHTVGTNNNWVYYPDFGVKPELIISKARDSNQNWVVNYDRDPTYTHMSKSLRLNSTEAAINESTMSTHVSNVFAEGYFSTGGYSGRNPQFTGNIVAYLFATLSGISKVGSYTGNGGTQNIECDFSAGARFIMIKRTDSTGDWYIWDTVRGIVAGNDPHLSLNTTVQEVTTDDSVDPYSAGFAVNQVAATNINVTSATYIFLAIS